jgi:hypothetical protein
MDLTYEYLWAAGYDLPPETLPKPADKPATPIARRGKKAARAKRQKGQKP